MFLCQLAIIYTEMGEYQLSNEILEKLMDDPDPELQDGYYFLANNYAHLGLFQEAKKYVTKYINDVPNGEYIEEAEDLLDVLSIDIEEDDMLEDEDTLIVMHNKACSLLEKGEFKEAIKLFEQLIVDFPEYWSAHNNLALAYCYIGNMEKALAITDFVLEKNEGNLHALCNLAIFSYYLNEKDKVRHIMVQLEKIFPVDLDYRLKLGTTFTILGNYKKGYAWLRALQKQHSYDHPPSFYYWLAIASYHIGEVAYAKEVWKKVIEYSPEKAGKEPWDG